MEVGVVHIGLILAFTSPADPSLAALHETVSFGRWSVPLGSVLMFDLQL